MSRPLSILCNATSIQCMRGIHSRGLSLQSVMVDPEFGSKRIWPDVFDSRGTSLIALNSGRDPSLSQADTTRRPRARTPPYCNTRPTRTCENRGASRNPQSKARTTSTCRASTNRSSVLGVRRNVLLPSCVDRRRCSENPYPKA